jgi:tripartite-type tricarboxylate transporter receptor subunit TctC
MQAMTGAQFTMIPFKGGEAVITALLGGHVEVTFDAFGKIIPHVDSGQLRILLVSKKMPGYPHIPTAAELGYKQGLLSTWFAFYGPSGLPEDIKKTLVTAIEQSKSELSELTKWAMWLIISLRELNDRKKKSMTSLILAIKMGLKK